MKMIPQSVANIRGMAGANVGHDPDLLCDIDISFFKKPEEQKEIEWPSLQDSLNIFSNAARDREQFLEQYLPDTEMIELWVDLIVC